MGDHQSTSAGILIPALQSAITGVLVGLAVGFSAALLGWEQPAIVGGLAGTLVTCWTWIQLLRRWHKLLEFSAGMEEPEPLPVSYYSEDIVKVSLFDDDGSGIRAELPVSRAELTDLAVGILQDGLSFSEINWTGSGKIFSRRRFKHLRDMLVARGLLEWKDPRSRALGLTWTRPGRAMLRYYSSSSNGRSPTLIESSTKHTSL